MRSRGFSFIASLALAVALASCATPSLYQPADNREGAAGYTEARLSETAWRVEFVGDDFTSRETVETYLLYRAAELTAENSLIGSSHRRPPSAKRPRALSRRCAPKSIKRAIGIRDGAGAAASSGATWIRSAQSRANRVSRMFGIACTIRRAPKSVSAAARSRRGLLMRARR
jgi:hypothetical protein